MQNAPSFKPSPGGVHTKLDASENPYPLDSTVLAALAAEISLHRYPDLEAKRLKAAWAARLELDSPKAPAMGQLVLGNGSDELIGLLVRTFSRPREPGRPARMACPAPSFPMFRRISMIHGAEVAELALDPNFDLSEEALESFLRAAVPNVIFLDRPNNPTGALWGRDMLERVARRHPDCIFAIDEACADYAKDCMVDLPARLPNVVVLRSLSKLGLAALRVGAVVAHPEVAAELEKGRLPFNVDAFAQLAAAYVLENHDTELSRRVHAVIEERERLFGELSRRPDLRVSPSQGNYLLFRISNAERIWGGLLERGVLVARPLSVPDALRVSIGTPEENDRFLRALDAVR